MSSTIRYTDSSTNREEDVPVMTDLAGGLTFSAMDYVPAQYTDVAQQEYTLGADQSRSFGDFASLIAAGDMDVATHGSMPQWFQVGGSQTGDSTATMGIPGHSQWSTTSITPSVASNTHYGDLLASNHDLGKTGKGTKQSAKPKMEGSQVQVHHRTGMTSEKRMIEYMWRPVSEMLDRIDHQLEKGFIADQDDNPQWLNQAVSNEQT